MFAIEADADVTGNPFIYTYPCVGQSLDTPRALSLSTASATGRHLKHTMHMSGAWEEGDKTRSGGRQLGVLSPNRGSCNCCCGNVFVGTWQSFKPKSFRSKASIRFYACILNAAIEMQVPSQCYPHFLSHLTHTHAGIELLYMRRMACLHINLIYAQMFFQPVHAKSAQILWVRREQRNITHTPRGRGREDHLRVFIKMHSIYIGIHKCAVDSEYSD